MQASDYDEMRRVFLEHPCKLYTSDIQSAFMHLTSGGRETDVAGLNRRNNASVTSRHDNDDDDGSGDNYNKYLNPGIATKKKHSLEPIALKNFKLVLVVPKQVGFFFILGINNF